MTTLNWVTAASNLQSTQFPTNSCIRFKRLLI